jgi:exosome complex RNA-binding protein Rrp42 (RNase PH superfamily)
MKGARDFRTISIENEIFPHLNGSSRVNVSNVFNVVCTVKVCIHILVDCFWK